MQHVISYALCLVDFSNPKGVSCMSYISDLTGKMLVIQWKPRLGFLSSAAVSVKFSVGVD